MAIRNWTARAPHRAALGSTVLALALAACTTADPTGDASSSPPGSSPPSSSAPSVAWERVSTFVDEDVANGSEVAREVVHGNAGFAALTETFLFGEGGPQLVARSLRLSTDGLSWEEVEFPLDINEAGVQALISTADGNYVLIYSTLFDSDSAVLGAITSADGRSWEAFDSGLPSNLGIQAIDHGALGWLLVGDRFGGPVTAPEAWYSPDGVAWERVAQLSEPERWVRVMDAAAGEAGFVIVGTSAQLEGPGHEWFSMVSADGQEWVPARGLFDPTGQNFQPDPHVAALGTGWVAALPLPDDSTQFWTSDDGLEWEAAGGIPDVDPETSEFDPVFLAVDERLYFSVTGGGNMYVSSGAWSSTDGADWEPLDLGGDVRLGGVATGNGAVVLVGTEITPVGSQVAIFVLEQD